MQVVVICYYGQELGANEDIFSLAGSWQNFVGNWTAAIHFRRYARRKSPERVSPWPYGTFY
jgi:hypothetical protein